MRKWVELRDNLVYVKFEADSPEEENQLDDLLGFMEIFPNLISGERNQTVEQGAKPFAEMGGHEKLRWIIIPLDLALKDETIVMDLKEYRT